MNRMRLIAAATAVLALAACGRVVERPTTVANAPVPATQGYVIEPGDELDVRFFYNPELNEEVVVRPDGNISLPLVGETRAAGTTPSQLENTLRTGYSRELRQAAITVIVKGFAGQRVYVDGEVGTPQMVNIAGNLSALQAIASAGGFKDSARKGEVLVIRRSGTPQPVVIPLDLGAVLSGADTRQDLALQPYDIVFVPKTAIAEVNQFIDQYFRQNIPIPFGVGYGLNN
ncbi:polysaccharide biosynthesis/export family protein [Magnetospirillum sp. UT-4]|uniref:polysaccharide biosynthesis/export family protein n=1 Tax=Magnetospirillum sp. UT-4 TaxID=2681467 RepID=UPI00138454B4|nr:polysaccharide biosynthesis/export family protein [Magnetospirillum sp. UT-4]CAA7615241.1 Polysaccharide export protein [Magnetospirillum sp. UT-4]